MSEQFKPFFSILDGTKKETLEQVLRDYQKIQELFEKVYDEEIVKTLKEKQSLNFADAYRKELNIDNIEKLIKLSAYAVAEAKIYFQDIFDKFSGIKIRVADLSLEAYEDELTGSIREIYSEPKSYIGDGKIFGSVKDREKAEKKELLATEEVDPFSTEMKDNLIVQDVEGIMKDLVIIDANLSFLKDLMGEQGVNNRGMFSQILDYIVVNYGFVSDQMKNLSRSLSLTK